MDKKYIKYSVEDFTQDLNFIYWVNKGIDQKDWENFVRENPNLSKDINTAKKIVSALRYNTKDLQEDGVYEIYKNIEIFHSQHSKSIRTVRFRKIMQYAAVFALVFSIGAAIPYFYFTRSNDIFTEIPVSSSGFDEAKLILSGGEEILLKEKQTNLQFNAAGNQIKIDKDSIIHYHQKTSQNTMVQVIIPFGRRSKILLSDGTKVWLNAGSKLVFPQKFTGRNRKVFLKGEAYFDVFKNKDIPFIVSSDNMNVTVHGTEFNMRDNDSENELEVVLIEGAVSLKENSVMNFLGKEIKLEPNQKAIYNKADNKTSVESNVDVAYYISWKEGFLEFNRESILNVFKRLSQFYNVRFVTESSVELNRKISGKLDLKETLEEVMKVVSDAAPISYRIDNNKVFVNSKINYLPIR
ncbi:MAG: FecR family protein [Ignavibacteria bacterium]|nr:FecR family protein [Ignavibacteria bacterium]